LYAGAAVGGGLLALVGALWLFLQTQNSSLQSKQIELDGQLATLTSKLKQVEALRGQINQVQSDTNALASVLNLIKPWSAMLQDIRERTPEGIQIQSVTQAEPAPIAATPSPSPAATPSPGATPSPAAPGSAASPSPAGSPSPSPAPVPPPPSGSVTITGIARSFSDVNDFVLVLQQSKFLQETSTKLLKAELVNNPVQIDLSGAKLQAGAVVSLPKVVSFTIQTSLSDIPASDLIAELNSNGAVGLVNRIETLRTKGVIQP
jgi:type IV pilus assembly protein PilN